MKTIMIDAGHGGHDSGAVGPHGLRESDVALAVAMLLGSILATRMTVVYTRRDDYFVELGRRAEISNSMGADLFLSIHCNSGEPGHGDGYEVFTTPWVTGADGFATALFEAYAEAFPEKRGRADMTDGDPDKEARFAVLRLTDCPAALFELEFIHTDAGEEWLGNRVHQLQCARALAAGVLRHLGINSNPQAKQP